MLIEFYMIYIFKTFWQSAFYCMYVFMLLWRNKIENKQTGKINDLTNIC